MIVQEQEKAEVVVICLDAAGPIHDQLGNLLKSNPTSEQRLLIEAGLKYVLEETLKPCLDLVLSDLEAWFTNLGDIPSDWKETI